MLSHQFDYVKTSTNASFAPFIYSTVVLLSLSAAASYAEEKNIEEIEVHAENLRYEIDIDVLDSANSINAEAIARMQSADVFSVIETIPGITIDGGLSTGGKSFSIRGFGDNEDVLVQIDGVTQNFEKYRSGSGVEIEPKLLKEIAIFRGGSSVEQGAGYRGGVVQMETKDARDFLNDTPDNRNWGATLRAGHNTNNDGNLYSITGYALPADGFDLLVNAVKRDTNNLTRPNGRPFEDSDEQQESLLAKAEYYSDSLIVSYSFRSSEDEGLEPFDLVENNAVFSSLGNVFRVTEEDAHSFRSQWNPDKPWINTDFVFGIIDKQVTEQRSETKEFTRVGNISNPISFFQYDIWTTTLKNRANMKFELFANQEPIDFYFDIGLQASEEDRSSEQEENGIRFEYALQPSGVKRTNAAFLQTEFNWNNWRLRAGIRRDRYKITPGDDTVLEFLSQRSGENVIRFSENTPSISVDRHWENIAVFARFSKAFSAPLVTPYFSFGQSGISRCNDFAEILVPPNLDDFGGNFFDPAFQAANLAFQAQSLAQPYLLEANYFCGDVYRNEQITTFEFGGRLDIGNWLNLEADWAAKITYFESDTKNTLDSIQQDPITLAITQPGSEFRSGIEFELDYQSDNWRLAMNSSTLNGDRTDITSDGLKVRGPLRAPPGDSVNVIIEKFFSAHELTIGSQIRAVRARQVDQNTNFNASVIDAQSERVAGYTVYNVYAQYRPTDALSLRFSVENLSNKEYQLRGFGGSGSIANVAAGRDYRFTVSYSY